MRHQSREEIASARPMTTRSILSIFILTCVLAAIVQPQEPRYLAWEPGKRIADRLSREDRHVIVDKHIPPLMGEFLAISRRKRSSKARRCTRKLFS
jgi:hypothetical protein